MEPNQLADYIESSAQNEFAKRRIIDFCRQSPTKHVMDFFGRLGKAHGFLVAADTYANGCAHADQGSWLYDMAWWTADDAGMLLRLDMIFESELKPGGSVQNAVDVDGDFQKLVQARASVRVWLTLIPNTEMVTRHIENCKRQIAAFETTVIGDIYILIIGDWTADRFVIERYQALA